MANGTQQCFETLSIYRVTTDRTHSALTMWTPLPTYWGRWSHYVRKVPELPPPEGSGRSLMPTHKPTCPHALGKKKRPGHQATTRFPSSSVSELPLTPKICFIFCLRC